MVDCQILSPNLRAALMELCKYGLVILGCSVFVFYLFEQLRELSLTARATLLVQQQQVRSCDVHLAQIVQFVLLQMAFSVLCDVEQIIGYLECNSNVHANSKQRELFRRIQLQNLCHASCRKIGTRFCSKFSQDT